MKKNKIKRTIIITVVLVVMLISYYPCMVARNKFKAYLAEKYPSHRFKIGMAYFEPIYGRFQVKATSDDRISFVVSTWHDYRGNEFLDDQYEQIKALKRQKDDVSKIIENSEVKKDIADITGIEITQNQYSLISVYLINDTNHIGDVKKIISLLQNKGISVSKLKLTWEDKNGLFEILLDEGDYDLSEKSLEEKVRKLK